MRWIVLYIACNRLGIPIVVLGDDLTDVNLERARNRLAVELLKPIALVHRGDLVKDESSAFSIFSNWGDDGVPFPMFDISQLEQKVPKGRMIAGVWVKTDACDNPDLIDVDDNALIPYPSPEDIASAHERIVAYVFTGGTTGTS